jgi:DNA-binding MarR family transcriptional regulator
VKKTRSDARADAFGPKQLSQLVADVSRIASRVALLSDAADVTVPVFPLNRREPAFESADKVRDVIRSRRRRGQYLPNDLFSDPAWDILLVVFHVELSQFRITITDLGKRADLPMSTLLRWVTTLTDRGLVRRIEDPFDGRRIYIELTTMGSDAMHAYLASVELPIA